MPVATDSSSEGSRRPRSSLTRKEWWTVSIGGAATTFAVAMTRVAQDAPVVRFWDNVHWTAAYGTAACLVLLARQRASGTMRRVRHWFAFSLGALFCGQLLWDAQVFWGWNPFPGPSDALFVSMGPLAILAILQFTLEQSRSRRWAIALDGLGFVFSVLGLTLAAYLPRRGDTDTLTMTVLAAYPTALLTATLLFLVVWLELKKPFTLGMLALGGGLLGHGLLWAEWNLATLEGQLGDGILLNYLFSFGTLLLGVGIAVCELPRTEVGEHWARVYGSMTRILPLGFVLAAAIAVASSLDSSPPVRFAINVCMGGVIVVAVLRQSLLLEEGDRLLRAEASNRMLSERMASSQRLEALGTLAGGIAHDFNNLLTAILGHAELLVGRQVGKKEEESVEAVRSAAVRARGVVQSILAFSRHQSVEKEAVDAWALVDEVRALLQAALPARHSIVMPPRERLGVWASPAQLHQVLMNLGTNASHAIGERAGTIRFTLQRRTESDATAALPPGKYVEISVVDDGAGMDAVTQARIFEPFFTTKGREKGTGLGLSVAHGIAMEHGGTILVASALGQGSTLTVLLPEAELPALERGAATEVPALHPAGREALVIDDEPAVALVMTRLLSRFGQPAVAFNDPERAVAAVRLEPDRFWLVITDMSMPTMSGEATAEQLRACGFAGTLVLSSGTDFVVAGTPFDDVLPKPYEASAVRALLARHRPASAP